MKLLIISGLLLLTMIGARAQEPRHTAENQTVVNLTTGKAQGEKQEGIYVYKGIPYAHATRFMPPEAPESWDGIRTFTGTSVRKLPCHSRMILSRTSESLSRERIARI